MNYVTENHAMYRMDDDGRREMMANFTAEIIEEVKYVDGIKSDTVFRIAGTKQHPDHPDDIEQFIKLPTLEVSADNYSSMSWVLLNWGSGCVVRPGSSIKDDLRAAIQLRSKPVKTVVYKHLGWTTENGRRMFIHAGGGITTSGNNERVQTLLPPEFKNFNIVPQEENVKECIKATLDLLDLCSPEVTWVMLAATLAPLYGPVDFGIHVAGRTGTFKSELMSLFQSHYGAGMDARHLPGSWSSTANALEAQAFLAANCPFVVDDFVPAGTTWQQRAYQAAADKLFRAQGNQAGRARLSDTSSLQQTMYPRGIILSTGEDIPEGHSVRGRMIIMELSPGDIEPSKLTKAQKYRALYSGTIAHVIQKLARSPIEISERVEDMRNEFLGVGHSRTPGSLARLVVTAELFLDVAMEAGVISKGQRGKMAEEARRAIEETGLKQQQYLEEADPVDQFFAGVRQVLASGGGHMRTLNGGVPLKPEILGWTTETSAGEMQMYKARGPVLGWVDWNKDELYIDVTAGYNVIRKAIGSEMSLTKQTLFKRIKDAGKLTRADEARQRNTIRITAENHPRNVIAVALSETLDVEEKP